jgi:hypothetical protein
MVVVLLDGRGVWYRFIRIGSRLEPWFGRWCEVLDVNEIGGVACDTLEVTIVSFFERG